MNVIAITQARTGSTRLPNKILKQIEKTSLLEIHLNRVLKAKKIDALIVATTTNSKDIAIVELCEKHNTQVFRGCENDVLDRFYKAANQLNPNYVVRLTSDCPLIDGSLIDELIEYAISNDLDYASNTLEENYPDGQDIEVFKFSALEKAWKKAVLKSEREHVTPYIYNNSTFKGGNVFSAKNYSNTTKSYKDVRLTVDEPKDFSVIELIIGNLGLEKTWQEYAEFYLKTPRIKQLNQHHIRNEGYIKSLKKDICEK